MIISEDAKKFIKKTEDFYKEHEKNFILYGDEIYKWFIEHPGCFNIETGYNAIMKKYEK